MDISRDKSNFFTSVVKAMEEIDPGWMNYNGHVLVGTHSPQKTPLDDVMGRLKEARENKLPTLGLCMGMQLMCIEYMRNVWGIKIANTQEIEPNTKCPVIKKLPELRVGIKRVGDRFESHWHNFAFNPVYTQLFEKDWDLVFSDGVLEEMRLKNHPYYMGVQYHPEYQSSKDNPHPILKEFINASKMAS